MHWHARVPCVLDSKPDLGVGEHQMQLGIKQSRRADSNGPNLLQMELQILDKGIMEFLMGNGEGKGNQ